MNSFAPFIQKYRHCHPPNAGLGFLLRIFVSRIVLRVTLCEQGVKNTNSTFSAIFGHFKGYLLFFSQFLFDLKKKEPFCGQPQSRTGWFLFECLVFWFLLLSISKICTFIVHEINAKNAFTAQVNGRRERERDPGFDSRLGRWDFSRFCQFKPSFPVTVFFSLDHLPSSCYRSNLQLKTKQFSLEGRRPASSCEQTVEEQTKAIAKLHPLRGGVSGGRLSSGSSLWKQDSRRVAHNNEYGERFKKMSPCLCKK